MPVKILLIEDNPDHLEITRRVLQSAGQEYQVDSAMDSKEGLKKISEGAYDAVLCDYRLPDATALEILKEINSRSMDIPFIVATALGNEKVAVDLMKEGAYDYIVKDALYKDTLDVIIKKAIDRYRTRKEKESLERQIREAYITLKETQGQLIQAAKLNAVGQLASGVAHEVRNPLGIILQGVNYLEGKITDKEKGVADTLNMLKENIKRADSIINALLDFSRATTLELVPEDIRSVLESSLGLVKNQLEIKNIEIVMEMQSSIPPVLADKNKLEQVFINILLNAIQAMPEGGKVIIRAYDKQFETQTEFIGRRQEDNFKIGERAVLIEIQDTGKGIAEDDLKKVFDPFFTTKGPKGGSGLGLSVSRNIINMHKGLIEISSRPGKGATVTITLKIAGRLVNPSAEIPAF